MRKVDDDSPDAAAISVVRKAAALTQEEAAALVRVATRSWQRWEAGEANMHPAFWELFIMKLPRK